MQLYLARHGEATSEQEDRSRPLSDHGRAGVERVAHAAARTRVSVGSIRHSGKLRARQTAEIYAVALNVESTLTAMEGLAPMDDPERARQFIREAGENLMLVGHLPHMNRLATPLLTGRSTAGAFSLATGALLCLEGRGDEWLLRWAITPDLV